MKFKKLISLILIFTFIFSFSSNSYAIQKLEEGNTKIQVEDTGPNVGRIRGFTEGTERWYVEPTGNLFLKGGGAEGVDSGFHVYNDQPTGKGKFKFYNHNDIDVGGMTYVNADNQLIFDNILAGDMIFRTNAESEKMRLKHDGNLGLQEADPQARLHFGNIGIGQILIRFGLKRFIEILSLNEVALKNVKKIYGYEDLNLIGNTTLDIFSGGDEVNSRIHIDSAGKVGIDLTSPNKTLHIKDSLRIGSGGFDGELSLYSEQGATDYILSFLPNSAMTQNVSFTFPINDGNSGEALLTDGLGNFYFGSPVAANLDAIIKDDTSITATDTGTNGELFFKIDNTEEASITNDGNLKLENVLLAKNQLGSPTIPSGYGGIYVNNTDGDLYYKHEVIGDVNVSSRLNSVLDLTEQASEPAVVTDTGRIYAEATTHELVYKNALGFLWRFFRILRDRDRNTQIQVEETLDEDKIRFDTKGSERMIIDDTGKVGIGTSSPEEALHVVGNIKVTGTVTGLSVDLASIQSACSNDFHNIGGVDDDTPDNDSEVPDSITIDSGGSVDIAALPIGIVTDGILTTIPDSAKVFSFCETDQDYLKTSENNDSADDVTLADVQSALSNDFHNVGGTDDDIPELGDFGNAVDLDEDGNVFNDSHSHTSSTITLASTDLSDTSDLLYEEELNSETELENQLIGVSNVFTNNDGSLNDDDVTLADVQAAVTNDFHNLGGTDATGGAPNLIYNGSFQYFYSGTTSQPDAYSDEGTPTVARDTGEYDNSSSTSYAVKYTATDSTNEGGKITLENLRPSTTYAVHVRAKATSGDTVRILTTGGSSNVDTETTSTSWTTLSGTFTTDSTPTDIVIKLLAKGDGDIVWFDQLAVEQGSNISFYKPHVEDYLYKQIIKAINPKDTILHSGQDPENELYSPVYDGVFIEGNEDSAADVCNAITGIEIPSSVNGKLVIIDSFILYYSTWHNDDYIIPGFIYSTELDTGTQVNLGGSNTSKLGDGTTGMSSYEYISSMKEVDDICIYNVSPTLYWTGSTSAGSTKINGYILKYHLKVHE